MLVPSIEESAPAEPQGAVAIAEALESSGLVMVETSAAKAQSWQPEAEPVVDTPRPRRRRQPVVAAAEEPLVMVETKSGN